jgi:hypothetical protein
MGMRIKQIYATFLLMMQPSTARRQVQVLTQKSSMKRGKKVTPKVNFTGEIV